jgi:hypothetical protein
VAAEVRQGAGSRKRNGGEIGVVVAEERMYWELKTCFKSLKRTQRVRGKVRDRRRAWRPRRSLGSGGVSMACAEDGSGEK